MCGIAGFIDFTKRILKDVVHRFVPKEMMERPKTGFSLPNYSWLRNDLSYLLDEFCSPQALRHMGFLNAPFLSKQVALFRKSRLHYSPLIWRLLMFQMWYHKWCRGRRSRWLGGCGGSFGSIKRPAVM